MTYEVEQKYPVPDRESLLDRVRALGTLAVHRIEQIDMYFAHPSREFAQTDEALRIRHQDEKCYLTYKGPKIDAETKSRQEIEVPIAGGDEAARQLAELLAALGFRRVADVRKQRQTWQLPIGGQQVTVAVDDVEGLGTFVELELMAEADQLESAQEILRRLASQLQLTGGERRSYLELLLKRDE
ncbi:MAG: class IV adenylate cyclase [Pirellulales bacterium]